MFTHVTQSERHYNRRYNIAISNIFVHDQIYTNLYIRPLISLWT